MTSKIIQSSYIVNFLTLDDISDGAKIKLEQEVDQILQSINHEILNDWKIHFNVIYTNVKSTLIFSKAHSFPVEKYKEIIIHLPIPKNEIVPWGIASNRHIYDGNQLVKIIKNFDSLSVKFDEFDSMLDYITASIKKAIEFILRKGFVISGVKVKLCNYNWGKLVAQAEIICCLF